MMIYFIITTSIYDKSENFCYERENIENRNNRYVECIKKNLNYIELINSKNINNMIIKPIIVENNGLKHNHTFLNEINPNVDVVYTINNIHNFSHKGVNEIMDIKEIIQKYKNYNNR